MSGRLSDIPSGTRTKKNHRVSWGIALVVLISAAYVAYRIIRWLPPSDEEFWRQAVVEKHNEVSYWFYGRALRDAGKLDAAEKNYRECMAVLPRISDRDVCKYQLGQTLYETRPCTKKGKLKPRTGSGRN